MWNGIRERPWHFRASITAAEIGAYRNAHVSCGGDVAFSDEPPPRGQRLRGDGPLWIGGRPRFAIEDAVKRALDPEGRFPELDDRPAASPPQET